MTDYIYVVVSKTEGSGHGYSPTTQAVLAFKTYRQASEYAYYHTSMSGGWSKYSVETIRLVSEEEALS